MTEPTTIAELRRVKRVARRLKTIDLDALTVATPCPASWAEMEGDDRSRFCGQCEKNVYDFSNLTRDEIATLLAGNDEKVCGRLYRRTDGTVLTADCPVGLAARLRRRLKRTGGVLAALALLLMGLFGLGREARSNVEMGDICVPPDAQRQLELRERARAEAEARHQADMEVRRQARLEQERRLIRDEQRREAELQRQAELERRKARSGRTR